MRVAFALLTVVTASLVVAFFFSPAQGLPEDLTKCMLNEANCSDGAFESAGSENFNPGCTNLGGGGSCNSSVTCVYCKNGPNSQVNICVQYYSGPGCITNDGSAPCGNEWSSTCNSSGGSICECDIIHGAATGNSCSFPTCTGNY